MNICFLNLRVAKISLWLAKISLPKVISLWQSQNFTASLWLALVGPSGLEPPLLTYPFVSLREKPLSLYNGFVNRLSSMVGPSGLEPPTSCLSGTRSNLLSYDPMWLVWFSHLDFSESGNGFIRSLSCVGIELSSRAASSQVFSPLQSLTSVFGMGTGGPSAFVTPTILSNP